MANQAVFTDPLFEFNVTQNDALCAITLWASVLEFYKTQNRTQGMPLQLSMLALPMALHRQTAIVIDSCSVGSGLYMVLTKDRTVPAGLQDFIRDRVHRRNDSKR